MNASDDKFIISSLNDEKSKGIAEILANKTARKILDYLSEHGASETEIANELQLPLSTVHYNVQKLLKTRLIEAKDHLWSEKGNRINIYTVARKIIVIAPKYARGYNVLKGIIPAIIVAIFAIALLTIIYNAKIPLLPDSNYKDEKSDLKRFSSLSELKDFIKANSEYNYLGFYTKTSGLGEVAATTAETSQRATEFSTTNIQVQGVDEADIVKNDDRYIYAVSGNSIVIVDAYPAKNAEIVARINLSGMPSEIFINNDKLIVFGSEQENNVYVKEGTIEKIEIAMPKMGLVPPIYNPPKTLIHIYDISDRANPKLVRNISFRGSYYDSRMIGKYVYAIVNLPVRDYSSIILPGYAETGIVKEAKVEEIYYFDIPDSSYNFATIAAINVEDTDGEIPTKVFMMGYTQNMYVSSDNMYITYTKSVSSKGYYEKLIDEVYLAVVPEDAAEKIIQIKKSDEKYYKKVEKIGEIVQEYAENLNMEERYEFQTKFEEEMQTFNEEMEKERQKTVIHRIAISKQGVEHKAEGEVRGNVLNQFSMDEYEGYFRIATTTGDMWGTENQKNNVYVLDMDLEITGKLEGLAEGERIYSARFLQDKVYIVTFRQVDPLFVIGLEKPEKPEVLGYLKVPGVSDYLHSYDKDYIIGLGRDATEEGRITGMKLSLFDISDFTNPREISQLVIGGSGTTSEALQDHKAFLFSKTKNLLVIPVTVMENWSYKFNGAYVFSINTANGFELKGKITHQNETEKEENEYFYADWEKTARRSLYLDNVLYTISNSMIKANNLENFSLEEINKVEISQT